MSNVNVQQMTYSDIALRDRHVYGHVEIGRWGNVLDMVHVPYNDTTYVLRQESNFGSTGGLGKSVVLYAVGSDKVTRELDRKIITHQFDRQRDWLDNFSLVRLRVELCRHVLDTENGSYGFIRTNMKPDVLCDMVPDQKAGCFISASYSVTRPKAVFVFWTMERVRHCGGSVEVPPEALTRANLRKHMAEWGLIELPPLLSRPGNVTQRRKRGS